MSSAAIAMRPRSAAKAKGGTEALINFTKRKLLPHAAEISAKLLHSSERAGDQQILARFASRELAIETVGVVNGSIASAVDGLRHQSKPHQDRTQELHSDRS